MVSPQQAVVRTRTVGGLAKVAQQGRCQNVLNQGRFTRTAHTGDCHQTLQGELDAQVLQIVFSRTFQYQPWRAVGHQTLQAQTHLLASAQIVAGQGVGAFKLMWCAIKNNLPAALTGARTHVHDAVCRQHHRRVVLDHHQGVACITQTQHGFGDAVHIAGMQTDAGLIQHKQGVHQRGAQGGG